MNLVVLESGTRVGHLVGSADRGVVFRYDTEYLSSPDARPLSLSLPLRPEEYNSKECLPFFTGLLPDGDLKRKISAFLHVSEASTLKLLDALGGECAGSVSLINEDAYKASLVESKASAFESRYQKLGNTELSAMVERMSRRPFLTGASNLRLSLAGAQQKLPLARFEGIWYLPLDGAPSTHIVKPSSEPYPDLAVNEYICMQVASLCGLPVPRTELFFLGDTPFYVIERYDRKLIKGASQSVERIHQEDVCQALGLIPDCKYEIDGGPGFSKIVSLVQAHTGVPILAIQTLLSLAVFNFLLGNCDAHGKNISFLYPIHGKPINQLATLAPLYDLVSTTVYDDLSTNLSMKIGGEYRIDHIRRNHFILLGEETHVGIPYMEKLLDSISIKVPQALERVALRPGIPMRDSLITTMREQVEKRIRQIGS